MDTIMVRLSFKSFFKIVFTGCLCASLMLTLASLALDIAFGSSGIWLKLALAPFTSVLIGTLFGLLGYPLYRLVAQRFVFLRRLTVLADESTNGTHSTSL